MPGKVKSRWQALGRRGRAAVAATVAVLVVVAGVGGWLLTRPSGDPATTTLTATVTSGTVQQTVSASGTVEPLHTADLDFAVSGTVTKVYVAAGDKVRKGQPLARVGNAQLVAASTAAAASLTAAEDQLATDEDDSDSEVQLAADRSAVVTAEASASSAAEAVRDAVLRSTISGTVTSVGISRGDTVSSGSGGTGGTGATDAADSDTSSSDSAFTVISSQAYKISATVSAADATELKKGLEATVTVTGATDAVYGTVSSVGLVAQTSDAGAAVFPVTIKVTGHPKGIYAGSSATASIVVKEIKNVVQVSSRAIETDSSGNAYVEKVVNGKPVKTPVKTGTVYGTTTQVLSGLKSGDVVQIPGFSLPTGLASRTGRSGSSGFEGFGGFGGTGGTGGTSGLGGGSFQAPDGTGAQVNP